MTPSVHLRINSDAFAKSLRGASATFDRLVMIALRRTVQLAESAAKTSTRYKSHTYKLRESIKGEVFGGFGGVAGAGGVGGRVVASAPYAAFVENGTRAHDILPRRKKVLRFVQNGAVRFASAVHHPGTAPRPFMADAKERATPLFEQLMSEAVARAFA